MPRCPTETSKEKQDPAEVDFEQQWTGFEHEMYFGKVEHEMLFLSSNYKAF